jgi:hypothetical protein
MVFWMSALESLVTLHSAFLSLVLCRRIFVLVNVYFSDVPVTGLLQILSRQPAQSNRSSSGLYLASISFSLFFFFLKMVLLSHNSYDVLIYQCQLN